MQQRIIEHDGRERSTQADGLAHPCRVLRHKEHIHDDEQRLGNR